MRARVCRVCAISGVLCNVCDDNLAKGIISDIEISVAKELYEAELSFRELQDISLEYVAEAEDGDVFVFVSSQGYLNPSLLLSLSNLLSKKMKKNVKIVEKSKDIKRLMSQFFYPYKVLSVNEVWSPDGSHEYNVRLTPVDLKRLISKLASMEKILSNLLSSNVRIITD